MQPTTTTTTTTTNLCAHTILDSNKKVICRKTQITSSAKTSKQITSSLICPNPQVTSSANKYAWHHPKQKANHIICQNHKPNRKPVPQEHETDVAKTENRCRRNKKPVTPNQ